MKSRKLVMILTGWVLSLFCISAPAFGHALKFGSVTLNESVVGIWQVQFRYSGSETSLAEVNLAIADNCRAITPQRETKWQYGRSLEWQIQCSDLPSPQWLEVIGVDDPEVQIIFQIQPKQGEATKMLMSGRKLHMTLATEDIGGEKPQDTTASNYLSLGIHHILVGADHLAFVFLMLLLADRRSMLLGIITAFTLGHTVTLILTSLGYLAFDSFATEVLIALSIVLLAAELSRSWRDEVRRITLTRRFPALAALLFGLVHGMGFAAVLTEIGLPKDDQVSALLFFNIGVEIGQVLFVATCLLIMFAMKHARLSVPRQIPVYGIGSLGAFFMFDRLL